MTTPTDLISQEVIDKAVKRSLEYNAKSGVMFLFRERMVREIIVACIPIICAPLITRIEELEDEIAGRHHGDAPKKKPSHSQGMSELTEAIGNLISKLDEP